VTPTRSRAPLTALLAALAVASGAAGALLLAAAPEATGANVAGSRWGSPPRAGPIPAVPRRVPRWGSLAQPRRGGGRLSTAPVGGGSSRPRLAGC